MARGTGRIVAELGRPETADETAARKAENSRKHRAKQTPNNLVLSLIVSMGVVLLILLFVPRPDIEVDKAVNYSVLASEAQPAFPDTELLAPDLPAEWWANQAQVSQGAADGIKTWTVGFITPDNKYIGVFQGIDANETWLAASVANTLPTGTVTIGGREWMVHDNRGRDDVGNAEYALTTEDGANMIALAGMADPSEFETLATAVAAQLDGAR